MRVGITFALKLLLLCLLAATSIPSAFGAADSACELPPGLQDGIAAKYKDARLVTTSELTEEDKKLWDKDHRGECPGLVKVDFYGDAKSTFALVLVSDVDKTRRAATLVMAQRKDAGWELRTLETTDWWAPVVWSAGPGKYESVYRDKTIRAKYPVIIWCGYYSWTVVYSWTGAKIQKVWLQD